jgi:hypothetical protein
MVEIAEQARGPAREEAGGDWRVGANDGLVIHRTCFWHDFVAGEGGHGALSLLAHFGDSPESWLAKAGDGRLGRGDGHDDESESLADAERQAFIETLWSLACPITLSPVATQYFAGRGLDPIAVGADSELRWLDAFRGDEGALLANISGAASETAALQITHIRPDGAKSDVQPVRKLLRGPHDWRRRGAFRLGSNETVDLVVVEGLEDAIAARMAGAKRVHACLGVAGLGRATLPLDVITATIARDGDPPGSPASLQFGRGVARVMLQGRAVKITPRPETLAPGAKDIADLVQRDVELGGALLDGADVMRNRLDDRERDAFLDEISRAEADAYEQNRKAIAAALNWRAAVLDDDRVKRRKERAGRMDETEASARGFVDFEPWPDRIMDIAEILDAAVAELKRFLVVAHPAYYDVIALWAAHTHLLHHERLNVSVTSRIAFQSPVQRCGKSTALKCTFLLSHKGRMTGSISPAALFRAIENEGISLMIDEADRLFKHFNSDMIAILNSGIDRMTAYAMRTVPAGERDYKAGYFSTFTGVAFTSIGALPIPEQQDRVIALPFSRAQKTERPEHLDVATRQGLIDVGRKFARWAADLSELPDIGRSTHLHNRIEDKWRTLFQVAKLAGAAWFERCGRAAAIFLKREEADDADGGARNADLLADVWRAFYDSKRAELHTSELCAALSQMDEAPWSTASNGRSVTGYFLRDNLKGFLGDDPEKIAPRKFIVNGVRRHGYHEKHFEDAFSRYLGAELPSKAHTTHGIADKDPHTPSHTHALAQTSKTSGHPDTQPKSDDYSETYSKPDAAKPDPAGPDDIRPERAGTDQAGCQPAYPDRESAHPARQKNEQNPQDTGNLSGCPDDFQFKPERAHGAADGASDGGAEYNLHNLTDYARGRSGKKP